MFLIIMKIPALDRQGGSGSVAYFLNHSGNPENPESPWEGGLMVDG